MITGRVVLHRDRLRTALGCVLISMLAIAAFLPVIGNDFVDVDDRLLVLDGSRQMQAPPAQLIRWAFTDKADCNWQPLTKLSHAFVARSAGETAPASPSLAIG